MKQSDTKNDYLRTLRRERITTSVAAAAANDDVYFRIDAVSAMTGMGKSTIYALVAAGKFPAPCRLSQRCSRFRSGAVKAWLKNQTM